MPAGIRKLNRVVAYFFFLGLAFVVSIFLGNRRSSDETGGASLIPPVIPSAQADITSSGLDAESGSCAACGSASAADDTASGPADSDTDG